VAPPPPDSVSCDRSFCQLRRARFAQRVYVEGGKRGPPARVVGSGRLGRDLTVGGDVVGKLTIAVECVDLQRLGLELGLERGH
jgi:hypothetical protein